MTSALIGGGGGALKYLGTVTAAGATEVDIEGFFDAKYADYEIRCGDLYGSSGGATVYARLKIGGVWRISNYIWYKGWASSGVSYCPTSFNSPAGYLEVSCADVNSGANKPTGLVINLAAPAVAGVKKAIWGRMLMGRNPVPVFFGGSSDYEDALTGVRLYVSAGTLTGNFHIYGVKQS